MRSTLSVVLAAVLLSMAIPLSAQERPRLLFLTHAGLYRHASLQNAEIAVREMGEEGGFDVVTVEGFRQEQDALDFSFLTPDYLAGFDGIMMMTNGNLPFTDSQKEMLIDFVRGGKGFVGAHNASLTFYDYPPFGEMLGAYFQEPIQQGHVFVLHVEDQDHPATRMLGPSWPIVDELYFFGTGAWDSARPEQHVDALFGNRIPVGFSRDRVRVLLSIDTRRTDLTGLDGVVEDGDYPQAWVREFGDGRSFYTSLGHREDIWSSDPVFRAHVTGGIRWALGLED